MIRSIIGRVPVQTTGRIIRGPWPLAAKDQAAPLRLQREDGEVLETFDDYGSAIIYREREGLGAEWVLHDARGEPSEEDRMMLLGMVIRDHLMSIWRRSQFDRLLHGDIRQIPGTACDGLQDASAAVAEMALQDIGHTGWSARYGQVTRPEGALAHAWIEHEDGTLLDFMADRLHPGPISIVTPDERASCAYDETRQMVDSDPAAWLLDLPEKIREVFPLNDPEPEFSM